MKCIVPNCKSKSTKNSNISFHVFPKEQEPVFFKWLTAIGMSHSTFKANSSARKFVCSNHFVPDAFRFRSTLSKNYEGCRPRLKANAIPNIMVISHETSPVEISQAGASAVSTKNECC